MIGVYSDVRVIKESPGRCGVVCAMKNSQYLVRFDLSDDGEWFYEHELEEIIHDS